MPRNDDVFPKFESGLLTFAPVPTFQYDGDLAQALQEPWEGLQHEPRVQPRDPGLDPQEGPARGIEGRHPLPR